MEEKVNKKKGGKTLMRDIEGLFLLQWSNMLAGWIFSLYIIFGSINGHCPCVLT